MLAVRVGFIGTGGIARSHLRQMLHVTEAEVVALCDLDDERIEEAKRVVNESAEEQSFDRKLEGTAYTDYRAMLRNEKLDAVFVCLPPFIRGEAEEAVLDANLHMFVEKPIALDLPLTERILKKAKEKGVLTSVGYQLRYLETMTKAKELLQGRTIGMATATRWGGTPGVSWFHRQDKSGGQLIEQATHHIDQLRYLIGEIKTVYAAADIRVNQNLRPNWDIFDVNCMTLTFENGVVANFSNNLISAHGTPESARGVHIVCENMTLSHNLGGPLEVITKEGKDEYKDTIQPMRAQDAAFVQAIAEGRPELIKSDYLNGIMSLAVTMAGELSARRGEPIEIMPHLKKEVPYVYELVTQAN